MAGPGKKRAEKAPAGADPERPDARAGGPAPPGPPAPRTRRSPRKPAGAVPEVDPERRELEARVIAGARRLCEILEQDRRPEAEAGRLPAPLRVGAPSGGVPLKEFLAKVEDLTPEECERVALVAEQLLQEVYVHLPLKRAMHAVDPIQRLRILRRRVRSRSAPAFHAEMLAIFHSLRDLHTGYVLPSPYQGRTAYLPFLVEKYFEGGDPSRPRFVVSKLIGELDRHDFGVGANLTHWSGVPIGRVVDLVANREAGNNDDAREARGLEALTIRPMALSPLPVEEWVVVGYEADGRAGEVRFEWMTFSPPPEPAVMPLEAPPGSPPTIGVDARTEEVRRVKKALFVTGAGDAPAGPATLGAGPAGPPEDRQGPLRNVFDARAVRHGGRDFGYVRIYTFMVEDADAFVDEFVRIVRGLPQDGLILDVRGNGGGNILAGERLLQTLTPRAIEPARLQLINSAATLELCHRSPADLGLDRWSASIALSAETGEVYSQALTLQTPEEANRLGQRYQGPVVLITDALCYSTTDIFAAGFQDHEIGPILGTSRQTGAGGANVWDYALIRDLLPGRFPELPGGANFRVAIRRTIRVGARSGVPVEDFGVEPDETHAMTRADVLGGNVDLIAHATTIVSALPVRSLTARVVPPGLVAAEARGVTRVDLYQGTRPLGSRAVESGRAEIPIEVGLDPGRPLDLRGFDGEELVVAATVPPGWDRPA